MSYKRLISSKTQKFTKDQRIFIEVFDEEAAKTENLCCLEADIFKQALWMKLPKVNDKFGKWRDFKRSKILNEYFEFNDSNVTKKRDPHM